MPAKGRLRITVDEDPCIVERLDAAARAEGLSRNDLMRRAIRLLLSSLSNSDFKVIVVPGSHLDSRSE